MSAHQVAHVAARDTIHVVVGNVLSVAHSTTDSLRIAGALKLIMPQNQPLGLLERWGIPAALLAILLTFLNHKLNQRLEDYKFERSLFITLLTQRSGVLSDTQLAAVRTIWEKLAHVHWDTLGLTAPVRSAPPAVLRETGDSLREAMAKHDQEEVQRIAAANAELWNALQVEKAFLPPDVFEAIDDYCRVIQSALQIVELHVQEQLADAYAPESVEALKRRGSEYRAQRDALREDLGKRYGVVATAIFSLTTPRFPAELEDPRKRRGKESKIRFTAPTS